MARLVWSLMENNRGMRGLSWIGARRNVVFPSRDIAFSAPEHGFDDPEHLFWHQSIVATPETHKGARFW